ncbi:MAG: DUF3299 domain-containing protein [Oceanospirillaceae bacterium]|nr:DUF3299 domain-containing protein [Oceanospirillaceae bacterium]
MKKLLIILLSTLVYLPIYAPLYAQSEELSWADLVPDSEQQIIDTWLEQQQYRTPDQEQVEPPGLGQVRTDLNGKEIKIAGFVIPLESDDQKITELLLVPYFGACFHVPPPPENQIIYVKFEQGIALTELWDVVYVVGVLQAEDSSHEMAEAGYVMQGMRIEEYEQ